jgi:hypothetical protein
MTFKVRILMGVVFLVIGGVWGTYVLSTRAFLRDYNAGVHAYLAGQWENAEGSLRKALLRRPHKRDVKKLFAKTLIERSFAEYKQKKFQSALATIQRASDALPSDDEAQATFRALRRQLDVPTHQRPPEIGKVLEDVFRQLPTGSQPAPMETLLKKWVERSEQSQEDHLRRFWESQEQWLTQLHKEKDQFHKVLYGGLLLFGLLGGALFAIFWKLLHAYFGQRGVFARLLEEHYRRVVAALPSGSHVLLGPPVSLHRVKHSEQMDSIEAELIAGRTDEDATRRLQAFLEEENPWVRARAAKILYRVDAKVALEELKRLVTDASNGNQVPGMWALAELGTSEALELLAPLAYSPSTEIQQGAIRSLLQLQSKDSTPIDVRTKIGLLLTEIRSRTGWVF